MIRQETGAYILSFMLMAFWATIIIIAIKRLYTHGIKKRKSLPDFYSIHKLSRYTKIARLCALHIIQPGVKMAILDTKKCVECEKEKFK